MAAKRTRPPVIPHPRGTRQPYTFTHLDAMTTQIMVKRKSGEEIPFLIDRLFFSMFDPNDLSFSAKPAGKKHYLKVSYNDTSMYYARFRLMHDLVWFPDYEVDHVSGNTYDNTLGNLQAIPVSENRRKPRQPNAKL